MRLPRPLAGLLLLPFLLSLAACDTLSYYGQAVSGQLRLLSARQDIDDLLRSADTEPQLKEKLEQLQAIRSFARDELALPLGTQFSTYVELDSPYMVWNVFAAPEFSLQPRTWCYPIAGCVSYRGFFQEARAREYAEELRRVGLDVYVGGVAAYSTLGWFSDPLPGSVLGRAPQQLAALVFHELAHQLVYVPGDTEFNESFATAVELAGLERWVRSDAIGEGGDSLLLQARQERERQQQFVALVQAAGTELEALYASGQQESSLRELKRLRLEQLRADYRLLKSTWQGYDGYDAWFGGELNNAKLSTIATYNQLVPSFTALLQEYDGDLETFYAAVAELAKLDTEARRAALSRAGSAGTGQQ